jgi:hypothetical protein
VDEVVEIIQVGHAFVGLTVASWAGNVSGNACRIARYPEREHSGEEQEDRIGYIIDHWLINHEPANMPWSPLATNHTHPSAEHNLL